MNGREEAFPNKKEKINSSIHGIAEMRMNE
jgi:hypothetical protein